MAQYFRLCDSNRIVFRSFSRSLLDLLKAVGDVDAAAFHSCYSYKSFINNIIIILFIIKHFKYAQCIYLQFSIRCLTAVNNVIITNKSLWQITSWTTMQWMSRQNQIGFFFYSILCRKSYLLRNRNSWGTKCGETWKNFVVSILCT